MHTSHGYMTYADHQEYLRDTDRHSIDVDLDDPPEWFDVPTVCPLEGCGWRVEDHGGFTVYAASGEITQCW